MSTKEETMTPETLSELKSLLEKATSGRWATSGDNAIETVDRMEIGGSKTDRPKHSVIDWPEFNEPDPADLDLILALRNSAPDLIKAVEQRDRYRAENKTLTEDNKRQKNLLRKYRLGQF